MSRAASEVPILRTSERKDFKRCMQRWEWAWRWGLKGKGRPADPLWFGIGVHESLANWYPTGRKRGIHPAEYWANWAKGEETYVKASLASSDRWSDDEWTDATQLGIAMLEGYVDLYGNDPAWEVIAPEQTFQIEIPTRSGNGTLVNYCGTFDLVYRDLTDDTIWLGEHKTGKQISISHLSLDDQAGGYWAIASKILRHKGVLRKGDVIAGIMYNFLKKAKPDVRPKNAQGQALNKDGSVSKNQPTPLFLRHKVDRTRGERATQLRRIQSEATWMRAARKNPELIIKTPTRDCSWDCSFFDMCELQEKGGADWMEYRDAMYTMQDPYADHRKSAGA
jgi:hypothetical protein